MSEVRDSFGITLSSDGSEVFANRNTPSDFRIQFPAPLQLGTGKWSVGLTSIQYPRYIANTDTSCFLKIWDGFRETVQTFPTWSCPSILSLLHLTSELMGSTTFRSTSKTRVDLSQRLLNKRNVTTDTIENDNYKPARHLEKEAVAEMLQQFNRSLEPSTSESILQDSDVTLPTVSLQYDQVLRYFDDQSQTRDDASTLIADAELSANRTLKSAIRLFKELNGSPLMDNFSAEPERYEVPVAGYDGSGRTYISTRAKEFDFCLSDTLRTKLGFTDPRFSENSYARRRFFSTYLVYMSKNPSFLNAVGLLNLKRGDDRNSRRSEVGSYYTYIKKIVNVLLQIPSEQVWVDFAHETADEKMKAVGMHQTEWPRTSDRWSSYFNNPSFFELLKVYENFHTQGEQRLTKTYRQRFRDRGSLIIYYMIKTLINELPLGRVMSASTPPQVNFPYDSFFIYSDIAKPIAVNESHMPLLALIQAKLESDGNTTIRQELQHISYIPCVSGVVPHIRIYIASTAGTLIPFMLGPVIVQLHFIQHSEP